MQEHITKSAAFPTGIPVEFMIKIHAENYGHLLLLTAMDLLARPPTISQGHKWHRKAMGLLTGQWAISQDHQHAGKAIHDLVRP